MRKTAMGTGRRVLRFNLVGAIGIGVQLAVLALLTHVVGLGPAAATALAVEAAVLHNFAWHERYTWADRASVSIGQVLRRLAGFNLSTGAISILGNVVITTWLAQRLHVPVLVANVGAIAACAVANFLVNDRVVFQQPD